MQPTDNYEFYRWNIEKLGFLWWLHSWKNMSFDSVVWLWYNKDMKLLLKISIYHPHKCIMNKSCLNLPSAKGRRDIVVKWRVYLILLAFWKELISSWKPVTCERPWVRIPLSPPLKTSYGVRMQILLLGSIRKMCAIFFYGEVLKLAEEAPLLRV